MIKACHRAPVATAPNGVGNATFGLPHTWSERQHADYIKQLIAFREGDRTNDGDSMIMRSIAAKSNKDIDAVIELHSRPALRSYTVVMIRALVRVLLTIV